MNLKDGDLCWAEPGGRMQTRWRKELRRDFQRVLAETILPGRTDYEAASRLLVKSREQDATGR